MSILKRIFLLFPPLNCWMDRSKDSNPFRLTGSSAVIWILSKYVVDYRVGLWESCTVDSIGYTCVTELPFQISCAGSVTSQSFPWEKSTAHLVILENLWKISLPAIISDLPSHLCAHGREDKWIEAVEGKQPT